MLKYKAFISLVSAAYFNQILYLKKQFISLVGYIWLKL